MFLHKGEVFVQETAFKLEIFYSYLAEKIKKIDEFMFFLFNTNLQLYLCFLVHNNLFTKKINMLTTDNNNKTKLKLVTGKYLKCNILNTFQ